MDYIYKIVNDCTLKYKYYAQKFQDLTFIGSRRVAYNCSSKKKKKSPYISEESAKLSFEKEKPFQVKSLGSWGI